MQRFFATLLVMALSPPLVLTLIVVWLLDRHAPVFIQERIGLNKKPFFVYKIRTMRNSRVTALGRVLRRTGIDELPQLFNIMKREMNFVGPRPLTEADIIRLKWDSPAHAARWSVRPGITGLAQLVNVCDAQVSWDCDVEYVNTRSLRTDLSILLKSLLVPFIGKRRAKQFVHRGAAP